MLDLSNYKPEWVSVSSINFDNKLFQFRKEITPESVAELAKSMAEDGQKFPVTLWRRNNGELVAVSGYRRITAAQSNKWDKVLALVIPESDMSEEEALKLNFVENVSRKSLNNLDIMFACQKLSLEQHKSNVVIGKLIGKSENQVRRYLMVAAAPTALQDKVSAGEVSVNVVTGESDRDGLAVHGEPTGQNNNNYVKSTKYGFKAFLNFSQNSDSPEAVARHIEDIKAALKQAQKLTAKKARLIGGQAKSAAKKSAKANLKTASGALEAPSPLIGKEDKPSEALAKDGDKDENASARGSVFGANKPRPEDYKGEQSIQQVSGERSDAPPPASEITGAQPVTGAEINEMKAGQQNMIEELKNQLKTPDGRAMLEAMSKGNGFNTPEEYLNHLEETLEFR